MKILIFVLLLIVNTLALTVPPLSNGAPSAGARVRVAIGSINYSLYLPTNYNVNGSYPVIFELPPNEVGGYFSGNVDSIVLGYGLTTGKDYIWVGAPFLNTDGSAVQTTWWGNGLETGSIDSTVSLWKKIVHDIGTNYHADTTKMLLCGFSRGAIATSYIGLSGQLRNYWAGFFDYAHMDVLSGCTTRYSYVGQRKTFASVGTLDVGAQPTTDSGAKILKYFGSPVTEYRIAGYSHDPKWILSDTSKLSKIARAFTRTVLSTSTIPTVDSVCLKTVKISGNFSPILDSITNGTISSATDSTVLYSPINYWGYTNNYTFNFYSNLTPTTSTMQIFLQSSTGSSGKGKWFRFGFRQGF
jgi:hypothetical protein